MRFIAVLRLSYNDCRKLREILYLIPCTAERVVAARALAKARYGQSEALDFLVTLRYGAVGT